VEGKMEFVTVIQELESSTEAIRSLLTRISQEQARFKPTNESWSILEVTCHLYDEEREDFREHLDFILHRQDEQWHVIDPQGWITSRKYNQQDFDELKTKFFKERKQSLEWLKGLSNPQWDTAYSSKFGTMKAGDMLAAWVAHDNLHIRQLVELRRAWIERMTQPYDVQYAGDW
jgi:hypothetical protein